MEQFIILRPIRTVSKKSGQKIDSKNRGTLKATKDDNGATKVEIKGHSKHQQEGSHHNNATRTGQMERTGADGNVSGSEYEGIRENARSTQSTGESNHQFTGTEDAAGNIRLKSTGDREGDRKLESKGRRNYHQKSKDTDGTVHRMDSDFENKRSGS